MKINNYTFKLIYLSYNGPRFNPVTKMTDCFTVSRGGIRVSTQF
jgi:hypothetical protein